MNFYFLVPVMMTLTNYANSQVFISEIPNNNVRLTVNPSYIVEGLESQVDIECTFKKENVPSMVSVMSMMIGYSNKTGQPVSNYLASVNGLEGHAHNVSNDVEVISGFIDNNGESKLHIRFMYAKTQSIGLYMCEVNGFDQIGKPLTIYSTVSLRLINLSFVLDLLDKAMLNISSLENVVKRQQECIDRQAGYILMMNKSCIPNYYTPIFDNGHEYYLSHVMTYFHYTEMQSRCEALGGYLAEVDTHEEFSFLRNYLMKTLTGSAVYTVWTGATDEGHEGIWINQHIPTARPTFDWAPGEPDRPTANCQCYHNLFNWYLADCPCYYDGPYHYICEVPSMRIIQNVPSC